VKSCVISPGNALAMREKMEQDLAFVLDFWLFSSRKRANNIIHKKHPISQTNCST
jgi:hypothetical protein